MVVPMVVIGSINFTWVLWGRNLMDAVSGFWRIT
jgi:hypothetical protein